MILFGSAILVVVLVAIALDAILGEPDWLWERLPHPVVLFGTGISRMEKLLNHPDHQSEQSGRLSGLVSLSVLVATVAGLGWVVQQGLASFGLAGDLVVACIGATLIAQKSLEDHVNAVALPLSKADIPAARLAVSMIVGRDPDKLDRSGIAKAAIESLAENFSDGVVAPLFWFCLLGLPGLFAYKMVNTADSMIGHRSDRYLHFGWASARLDDLLNFVPARIAMLLLLFSPFRPELPTTERKASDIWPVILLDAPLHRSPNAGWPEAAMAARLDIALSGPRHYGNSLVEEPYVNATGNQQVGAAHIFEALRLYRSACLAMAGSIAVLGLAAFLS